MFVEIRDGGTRTLPDRLLERVSLLELRYVPDHEAGDEQTSTRLGYVCEIDTLEELLDLVAPYGGCDLSAITWETALEPSVPVKWDILIQSEAGIDNALSLM